MNFTSTHWFPITLDRLWKLHGTSTYQERKCVALGADTVSIRRFVATSSTIELALEHDEPVEPTLTPPWFGDCRSDRRTLREGTLWRHVGLRRLETQVDIDPVGVPATIHGRGCAYEPIRGITLVSVAWSVTSTLPYLGAEVERLLVDRIKTTLRNDRAFTVRYAKDVAHGRGATDLVLRPQVNW